MFLAKQVQDTSAASCIEMNIHMFSLSKPQVETLYSEYFFIIIKPLI